MTKQTNKTNRTNRTSRNKWMRWCSLAIVAALTQAAVADRDRDVARERLGELRAGARCDEASSPWRPWCVAAAYDSGTAAPLPTGKVLVGLSVRLDPGKDVAEELHATTQLSAWAVGDDGRVSVTAILPSTPDENREIFMAVPAIAAVLKGVARTAELPADIAQYLATLRGSHPATRAGSEWTWGGVEPARARKVGAYWVVLERAGSRIDATVLTDAWR
jgi:hypothetical protein